jgi:hypothetical protein
LIDVNYNLMEAEFILLDGDHYWIDHDDNPNFIGSGMLTTIPKEQVESPDSSDEGRQAPSTNGTSADKQDELMKPSLVCLKRFTNSNSNLLSRCLVVSNLTR